MPRRQFEPGKFVVRLLDRAFGLGYRRWLPLQVELREFDFCLVRAANKRPLPGVERRLLLSTPFDTGR